MTENNIVIGIFFSLFKGEKKISCLYFEIAFIIWVSNKMKEL